MIAERIQQRLCLRFSFLGQIPFMFIAIFRNWAHFTITLIFISSFVGWESHLKLHGLIES